jgi:hypothetical protein
MHRPIPRPNAFLRRGSTLLELIVELTLTSILLSVIGSTWTAMNRASAEVIARYELIQEADLAFARLSDDLRGIHSTQISPRQLLFGPNQIQIVVGTRVVTYEAVAGSLIRSIDPPDEPDEVVGHHIESLAVQQPLGSGPIYQVTLVGTLPAPGAPGMQPNLRRSFQLLAVLP